MLKTITRATQIDLTSLAAVRLELGHAASAEHDTLIASLITQASAMLASETSRGAFAVEELEQTEHVRAPLSFFLLDRWPVVEVVSCLINGETIPLDGISVDASDGFALMRKNSRASLWPLGETVIRYRAGYVLTGEQRNLPPELERAAISVTKALFFARARNPQLRSETVEGVGSFSFVDSERMDVIGPDVRAIIDRHRMPLVA